MAESLIKEDIKLFANLRNRGLSNLAEWNKSRLDHLRGKANISLYIVHRLNFHDLKSTSTLWIRTRGSAHEAKKEKDRHVNFTLNPIYTTRQNCSLIMNVIKLFVNLRNRV